MLWTGEPDEDAVQIELAAISHPGADSTLNTNASWFAGAPPAAGSGAYAYGLCVGDRLSLHQAGEVASQTAVATIRDLFTTRDSEAPARFLPRAVQQANTAVYAAARTDRELFNMQTSLTALLLHPQELVVAHVGD